MNWSDISPLVAAHYPELSEALQGPHAAAVGGIIAVAIGKGAEPTPDAVLEALHTQPDLIKTLKSLNVEAILAQLPIDRASTSALTSEMETETSTDEESSAAVDGDDTSSARRMQIVAMKRGKGDFTNRFAVVVFLCSILLMSMMLFLDVGPINDNMRFYVLGFLQAVMMAIITFYFGSTRWNNANAGQGK